MARESGRLSSRQLGLRERWRWEGGLTLQAGLQDIERMGDKGRNQAGGEASDGLDD